MKALLLISSLILALPVQAADKLIPIDEAGVRKLIESSRGSVVLVSFWATWCEPCREELPQILTLAEQLRSKPFKLMIISADEPEQEMEASQFLHSKKFSGPAYIKRAKSDEKFIDSMDPEWSGALPALFLFDRKGVRKKSWIGESEFPAIQTVILRSFSTN